MAEKAKREPLIKLEASDKKLSALDMVKARAASRTRMRIQMELNAKENKRLELAAARGEISVDEFMDRSSKKTTK